MTALAGPSRPPSRRELERAADTLLTASRALVGISIRSLNEARVGVTLPQHRVLVLLAAHGPQTIRALTQALGVNQSNVSRLVDRLARHHLVKREPSPTDGRSALVHLQTPGRSVLDAVSTARRAEIVKLLGQVSAAECDAVARGVASFNRVAGEPDDADWHG